MATEQELIAKAKRAALRFGMSKSEADAAARQVLYQGTFSRGASAARDAVSLADRERVAELERLRDLVDTVKSNPVEWGVRKGTLLYNQALKQNVMNYHYHVPQSVIDALVAEATARIQNAHYARIASARAMNPK